MRTYSTSVICSRPCISAPCMHVHFISLLMCSSHPSRKLCERKFSRRCLRRPMKLSQPRGGNRTRAPDRAIEQYCATADSSDDFVLRSGESIPLQVRDVLLEANDTGSAERPAHSASEVNSKHSCFQRWIADQSSVLQRHLSVHRSRARLCSGPNQCRLHQPF